MSVSASRPPGQGIRDGAGSDPVVASAEYAEFYAQNVRTMPVEQASEVSYRAARSALVPKVWPVVVMTIMLGTLGVIWAASSARRAARYHAPRSRYWFAWGAVQLVQGMSVCLAVLQR